MQTSRGEKKTSKMSVQEEWKEKTTDNLNRKHAIFVEKKSLKKQSASERRVKKLKCARERKKHWLQEMIIIRLPSLTIRYRCKWLKKHKVRLIAASLKHLIRYLHSWMKKCYHHWGLFSNNPRANIHIFCIIDIKTRVSTDILYLIHVCATHTYFLTASL